MKKFIIIFFSVLLFAENENNLTDVIVLDDYFKGIQNSVNISIVVNKKKFSKYLPNLINSINSYLIYKNVDYNLTVYSTDDNLSKIENSYIFYIDDVKSDLNKTVFYPVIRSKENDGNYYGGIDYKSQLKQLSFYMEEKGIAISSEENLSLKILNYEKELDLVDGNYFFPKINYKSLRKKYLFLNTSIGKSVQVLSDITYYGVNVFSILTTQINYSPYIISLTQPQDRKKLLIANSIVHIPTILKDYNRLLDTDIEFNWLNYTTSVLLNKLFLEDGDYYLSDFDLYLINNNVVYPVNIYQIRKENFEEID